MKVYKDVVREGDTIRGKYSYNDSLGWISFSADWSLFRISEAIENSDEAFRAIWAIQDGYGSPGFCPVQGYDWSGIRDSSEEAVTEMDRIASEFVSDADLEKMLGLVAT